MVVFSCEKLLCSLICMTCVVCLHGIPVDPEGGISKRDIQCQESPPGAKKPCILCNGESDIDIEDKNGFRCKCPVCRHKTFMAEPCTCTEDNEVASGPKCNFTVVGETYMDAPNVCEKPYPCSNCTGDLVPLQICDGLDDTKCGCPDGRDRIGMTSTCSPRILCPVDYERKRVQEPDSDQSTFRCEPCEDGMHQPYDNSDKPCVPAQSTDTPAFHSEDSGKAQPNKCSCPEPSNSPTCICLCEPLPCYCDCPTRDRNNANTTISCAKDTDYVCIRKNIFTFSITAISLLTLIVIGYLLRPVLSIAASRVTGTIKIWNKKYKRVRLADENQNMDMINIPAREDTTNDCNYNGQTRDGLRKRNRTTSKSEPNLAKAGKENTGQTVIVEPANNWTQKALIHVNFY